MTTVAPQTRGPTDDEGLYARRLAAGFAVLVALTFGLIVLGALVRANDAGLACPDWPLCFGEFLPQMNLQVGFEWSHRVVAGGISLCFVALATLSLRRPATRARCQHLLVVAAVLLGVQVMLGALTVWQLLAAWTVTSHLVIGNSFAVVLLWTALSLRELGSAAASRSRTEPAARNAIFVAAALLALQLSFSLKRARHQAADRRFSGPSS